MAATRGTQTKPTEPPPTTKPCPACAESVPERAVICRYCRYDFNTGWLTPRTNPASVVSLTLGILALFPLLVFPPAALVAAGVALGFGLTGRNQTETWRGWQRGGGLAVAGIVLGIVGVVIALVATVVFLVGAGQLHFNVGPGF